MAILPVTTLHWQYDAPMQSGMGGLWHSPHPAHEVSTNASLLSLMTLCWAVQLDPKTVAQELALDLGPVGCMRVGPHPQ